jgi:hypothetical protein
VAKSNPLLVFAKPADFADLGFALVGEPDRIEEGLVERVLVPPCGDCALRSRGWTGGVSEA